VTVVYEIVPEQTPGAHHFATLRVRYKNPGETLSRLNEYEIENDWSTPSDDMRFITAVIETAALLRNREYEGDVTLQGICGELNELVFEDAYKVEFRELIRKLSEHPVLD